MVNFSFDMFPLIETDRLQLRQVDERDVDVIMSFRNDPRSRQYTGREPYKSKEEAMETIKKGLESYTKSEGIFWAITEKGNDAMIGGIGYWRIIKDHYRAEMGISILPEHWTKGYATEAMVPVMKFGFDKMGLHTIEANAHPDNVSSKRVLEKSGFQLEGHLHENVYFQGKFQDTLLYSKVKPKN